MEAFHPSTKFMGKYVFRMCCNCFDLFPVPCSIKVRNHISISIVRGHFVRKMKCHRQWLQRRFSCRGEREATHRAEHCILKICPFSRSLRKTLAQLGKLALWKNWRGRSNRSASHMLESSLQQMHRIGRWVPVEKKDQPSQNRNLLVETSCYLILGVFILFNGQCLV